MCTMICPTSTSNNRKLLQICTNPWRISITARSATITTKPSKTILLNIFNITTLPIPPRTVTFPEMKFWKNWGRNIKFWKTCPSMIMSISTSKNMNFKMPPDCHSLSLCQVPSIQKKVRRWREVKNSSVLLSWVLKSWRLCIWRRSSWRSWLVIVWGKSRSF